MAIQKNICRSIESGCELIDLGASAAIRKGVEIDINKSIVSENSETNGHTPLTYSIYKVNTTAVRALVDEAGANPNRQSANYGLPLSGALLNPNSELKAIEKERIAQTQLSHIAHTLISRGADINQESISSSRIKTPEYVSLETAAQKLREEIAGDEAAQKRILAPKKIELNQLRDKDLKEAEKKLAKASELEKSKVQKEVNSIKAEIQQIQKEIDELERSQEFRELGDKLTRTRKSLQSNVRDIKTLKQRGKNFNITETCCAPGILGHYIR